MLQEEKELLLKDLVARLPYGVICDRLGKPKKLLGIHPTKKFPLEFDNGEYMPSDYELEDIKPYLRPMQSITKEEKMELCSRAYAPDVMKTLDEKMYVIQTNAKNASDFFNEHHFDYRGLIEKGLALEAPENMYKL